MKKLVVLFVFLCLLFRHADAQTSNVRDIIRGGIRDLVESKWETNPNNGMHDLNYYNNDYCPYILARANDKGYFLRPGKTTVFTIKPGTDGDNPFRSSGSYIYYRGNFPKDFSLDTPYALPVKEGGKTSFVQDRRQPVKTMRFSMEPYDTVYAIRGGVACNIEDGRSLLVCHQDNTFSVYVSMSESFIVAGEKVEVGQAVGTADHGGLGVSVFFLDKNRFSAGRAEGYPYAHFVPVFSTSEGYVQIEEDIMYEAVLDDEVITLDMSRMEKKKYYRKKK